jgi:hypothetical protein
MGSQNIQADTELEFVDLNVIKRQPSYADTEILRPVVLYGHFRK